MTQSLSASLLRKITRLSKQHVSEKSQAVVIKFIKLYYANLLAEDINQYTPEQLFWMAYSHWQQLVDHKVRKPDVKVFNPTNEDNGFSLPYTLVQVTADDSPFLVDSLRMLVNRYKLPISLVIRLGGIKLVYGKSGQIVDVLPRTMECSAEKTVCLAPILLEIEKQSDKTMLSGLQRDCYEVLNDVELTVRDWQPMLERASRCIDELNQIDSKKISEKARKEAVAFLKWMTDNNFTFLGSREYKVVGTGKHKALTPVPGSSLGVLIEKKYKKQIRYYADLPDAARDAALSSDSVLLISKTSTKSTVHRPAYTDYIAVKRFDSKGQVVGECRFVGLYTTSAYSAQPADIPYLRQKVSYVLKRSGLPVVSHGGRDLSHILNAFPRDDLFHISNEELFKTAMGILQLQERRQVRLFVREDTYGRYISCMVYLPRENYNTALMERIRACFAAEFNATEVIVNTRFAESVLVRVHYIVRIDQGKHPTIDVKVLEEKVASLAQTWQDALEIELSQKDETTAAELFARYNHVFPAGYREIYKADQAAFDIERIERLNDDHKLEMHLHSRTIKGQEHLEFRIYRLGQPIPLSDIVPIFENLGLRVLSEAPYSLHFGDGRSVAINEYSLVHQTLENIDVAQISDLFQEAFLHVWHGDTENDGFNRLLIEARLSWREIGMLRAYSKYLKQISFSASQTSIIATLRKYVLAAQLLVSIFEQRFNPTLAHGEPQIERLVKQYNAVLDEVGALNEDRILRRYLNVIMATLRTNFYQLNDEGGHKQYLSFKLSPHAIVNMPLPMPQYEIFVYSTRFEGVHLRAAKVARGGLRWSDRADDFRTEVLGLMKAQQVKNAVIVPAGGKGGFYPKYLPFEDGREAVLAEAISCYQNFIRGLLDVTDNLVGGDVVTPPNTVRYDEDDHYLVVAADKGTATFSDIANQISCERGFWLGDAFASGGSTGYDHKKIGITARGAWVSAERHFQDMGLELAKTTITVAGIGDMGGDVFGNGLLCSKHIKLVAAFNHLHIFVDPNPKPAESFKERKRLFKLPRSSWKDYDAKLISKGGGVFDRTAKSIKLTAQMKELFGTTKASVEPNELIRLILKMPVDMIWNGGIGTYVKSSDETSTDVGDRTNDALRVDGAELKAKVFCEGGNLGLTQKGRIEYALNGGRINTDFIDNSAGVDCSDHEVNIKILLNQFVESKRLSLAKRNALLEEMTDQVAHLVLEDNYKQNQAISFAKMETAERFELYRRFIEWLEEQGKIDRTLEALPDAQTLMQRRADGSLLTRPELCVLFAVSKITIKEAIINSDLVNNSSLSHYVEQEFPEILCKKYGKAIHKHRLYKELLATQITNQLVNDMGITFVYRIQDEMDASIAEIVKAYVAITHIFHMSEVVDEIQALDYQIDAEVQYEMMGEVMRVVRRGVLWVLRNHRKSINIETFVAKFGDPIGAVFARLPKLLGGHMQADIEQKKERLIVAKVPEELADKIALGRAFFHALNIAETAKHAKLELHKVAKVNFLVMDKLDLLWFRDLINLHSVANRWSALAKAGLKTDLDIIQRKITVKALRMKGRSQSSVGRVNEWAEKNHEKIDRYLAILTDLHNMDTPQFDMLVVAIKALWELAS